MKNNILLMVKKILFVLLLLSPSVAPFVFIPQWASYVGLPGFEYSGAYRTSLIILMIREGLPILFVALVILTHRSFCKHRSFLAIILFVSLIIFGLLRILINPDTANVRILGAITGVRFCMFFLLPYAIFVFFNELSSVHRESRILDLIKVLIAILLINFIVSVFPAQVKWAYGQTLFGNRAIGITNGANSCGALMGLGALLLLFYEKLKREWVIAFIFFFGALLTGSRTSVVGTLVILIACLFIIPHKSKSQKLLMLIVLILLPYVIININNVTRVRWTDWGKAALTTPATISAAPATTPATPTTTSATPVTTPATTPATPTTTSATPVTTPATTPATLANQIVQQYKLDKIDEGAMRLRIGWFKRFLGGMNTHQLLFGYGLGYGTNLAAREGVLVDPNRPELTITDSFITLMLVNFGILGSIFCGVISLYFIIKLVSFWPGIIFILYYFLFGLTQNLIESYPTTVLFGVLLGSYSVYHYNSMIKSYASKQKG